MPFSEFMYKPEQEYDLFMRLSEDVKRNFKNYQGQHYYLHLSGLGQGVSQIDEVKQFIDLFEFGDYLYVERDHEPCIVFRSDPQSIGLLLTGRYEFAEHTISADKIILSYPRGPSNKPMPGEATMSSVEIMQAFGRISDSLKKPKGNVA